MRVLLVLAVGAVVVAGCGGSASRALPNVVYFNVVAAFERLHDAGFRVSVPYFPPFAANEPAEQGRGQLSNYVVVGERRRSGNTVVLTVTLPRRFGPMGSVGGRFDHPARVVVPNLVGETYYDAREKIGDAATSGMWMRLGSIGPLEPGASSQGIGAFRVTAQRPKPGTVFAYEGEIPGDGVRPASATVTVALGSGAAGAERRAAAALDSAWSVGGALGPFARTAAADSCRIGEGGFRPRSVYGRCFTGVDLSGKDAVVVYRQLWDGRDFRGGVAPARPDLEHVWEVTVSPAGHVLSVRSFGAFPPQLAR